MELSRPRRTNATSLAEPVSNGMPVRAARELTMVFPYWLPSDDDDAEPWPPVDHVAAGKAENVLWWADEGDRMARRSVDEWIVERAAEALARDPLVRGRRLEVEVQNGVIILLGVLASAESRDAAGRRAWTVEGVVDVCNRICVSEEDWCGR